MDVLERVSSILKDFGFCPPEEIINIGNLYCLTFCNASIISFFSWNYGTDVHLLTYFYFLEAAPISADIMKRYLALLAS